MVDISGKIKKVLEQSKAIVEDVKIPENLRSVAFSKTFDLLWSVEKGTERKPKDKRKSKARAAAKQEDKDILTQMAELTDVSREELAEIYYIEDEKIRLLKTGIPGKSRREKQRSLSALILWPNKLIGREEIGTSEISYWMNELGIYDRNLNRIVKSKPKYVVSKGKGRGMKYRLTLLGEEKAKKTIREMLGER